MITINTIVYKVILTVAVVLLVTIYTLPGIIRRRKSKAINSILYNMLLDLIGKFDMSMITHIEINECKQKIMSKLQMEDLLKYIESIHLRKRNDEIYACYSIDSTLYYFIVTDSNSESQSVHNS